MFRKNKCPIIKNQKCDYAKEAGMARDEVLDIGYGAVSADSTMKEVCGSCSLYIGYMKERQQQRLAAVSTLFDVIEYEGAENA